MKFVFLSFILLFLSAFNLYAADLTITKDSKQHVITDQDLQKLHLATVDINDPVYNKHKRYAGYWLSDIFDLAGIHLDTKSVWIFTALDGYKVRISSADAINSNAKALVAIKDLDATQGQVWEKFQQGKEWITPTPFYLVWKITSNTSPEIKLPWPYQMISITIRDMDEAEENLFPDSEDKTESIERGYKVFRQNCLACHSINLEGGTLAPELNVPRNIFEYRDRKILKEFIGDPSSFRAKSKMPSFNKILTNQSTEDVLDYLTWIGKYKIKI